MQQQYQHEDVDGCLQDCLDVRARHPSADQNNAAQSETEIKYGGAKEKLCGIDRKTAHASQGEQAHKYQRDQNPIQIKDGEHSPVKCGIAVATVKLPAQAIVFSLCAAIKLNLLSGYLDGRIVIQI